MDFLIDSHCHLDFSQFKNKKIEDILQNAKNHGVSRIVNIGCSLQNSENSIALAEKHPEIYATVGVHPIDSGKLPSDYLKQLYALAQKPKVVAIGEIGLDYFHNPERKTQREVFEAQLEMSFELNLPVVLHVRDAYADVLEILQKHGSKYRGILHCFTEEYILAQPFLEMGFLVSFNGIITFHNANKVRKTAQKMPLEKIVLETDAPFLAPKPHRGKNNEPAYVKLVAEELALLKKESFNIVRRITTKNVFQLFNLS